ncbi:MAG: hypothetical protein J5666_00500, partial [Bacilli bacterium]|nr:hypothetical protein [Bacilli bacterium]
GTEIVLNLISSLHSKGKTIILVTLDMNVVLKIATDVVALKEGKLAFIGSPHDLFNLSSEDLSLDIPPLFSFAKSLKDKGLNINLDSITTIDDLINQIGGNND